MYFARSESIYNTGNRNVIFMLVSTEISLALIHGYLDSIEDYFVAPSAPTGLSDDRGGVIDFLQRVEPPDRQTNDSPERPDNICRAFGGHATVQVSRHVLTMEIYGNLVFSQSAHLINLVLYIT